ncbi:MAG: hypothetical protein NXI31_26475 [bacterium]|nr:hypothetical protein [bacterium]
MRELRLGITVLFAGLLMAQGDGDRLVAKIPDYLKLEGTVKGPGGEGLLVESQFRFGVDGQFVAYNAFEPHSVAAVVNDKVVGIYSVVDPAVVDPTGRHFAMRAWQPMSGKRVQSYIITGDGVRDDFAWVGRLAINQKGEVAFWEQPDAELIRGTIVGSDLRFHVGRRRGRKYSGAQVALSPCFTPDGKFVATAGKRKKEWFALVGKGIVKAQKPGLRSVEDVALAPDGSKFACTVLEADLAMNGGVPEPPGVVEGKRYVLLGKEKLGLAAEEAGVPTFGPHGKNLVFKYLFEGSMGLAFVGEAVVATKYGFVGNPVFDSSGETIAYAAVEGGRVPRWAWLRRDGPDLMREGRWSLYKRTKNGQPEPLVDQCDGIAHITFGPNGELAYAQKLRGKWFLIVDGRRSEACDSIDRPWWSADGKRVEFGARRDRELWWKVLELE